MVGDQFGYWQFFPPTASDVNEWGILPVWGFADVVVSNAEGVPVGERLFGYFPPANYLKMTPTHINDLRWLMALRIAQLCPQATTPIAEYWLNLITIRRRMIFGCCCFRCILRLIVVR